MAQLRRLTLITSTVYTRINYMGVVVATRQHSSDGSDHGRLILLSYIIAVMASYTALDLAGRVTAAHGRARRAWLLGGWLWRWALASGQCTLPACLAFSLPIALTYDVPTVLLSLVVAMIASGFALFVASRDVLSLERLLISGLPMGLGIATMHDSGMACCACPR